MESAFQSTDPQDKKKKKEEKRKHTENCANKYRGLKKLSIGLFANCHYVFGGMRKNGKGKPREKLRVAECPSMEASRLCWTQRFLRVPLWLLGIKKLALDLFSNAWKRGWFSFQIARTAAKRHWCQSVDVSSSPIQVHKAQILVSL